MERLVLASASQRRREILLQMGLSFSVIPAEVDESFIIGADPRDESLRLAEKKARAVALALPDKVYVLGADTFIVFKGKWIGKPANREEAGEMLKAFSGRTHRVVTGLALLCGKKPPLLDYAVTDVTFRQLSEREIDWYLNTEEWAGVAGAYRIQEQGACFITSLTGSYSNVMGLPIHTFYGMLLNINFPFP